MKRLLSVIVFVLFVVQSMRAQQYDLLLKGGHVIDPKNKIDAEMDVAVSARRENSTGGQKYQCRKTPNR